jgi:hypothetical protein
MSRFNIDMQLPSIIAQPLVYLLYRIERRKSPIPPIKRVIHPLPADEQLAFDNLLDSTMRLGPNRLIDYRLPYPKSDFLNYICDWRGYVAHGSPIKDLTILQPIRLSEDSSEFGNRQQVFCSPDGIWAIWFAILDKSKSHVTENGCVRVGRGQKRLKYYHFDLPVESKSASPFTDGIIYIAKAEQFPFHRPYPLLEWLDAEIEEWGSVNPVTPLAKLQVKPEDFPYLDKVQFQL